MNAVVEQAETMPSSHSKTTRAPLIALLRMRAVGETAEDVILECFRFVGEKLADVPNEHREALLDRCDVAMDEALGQELCIDETGGGVLWYSDQADPNISDDRSGDDGFILMDQRDVADEEMDDAGEDRQEEREISRRRTVRPDRED